MKVKRVEHVAIAVNDMAESMKMMEDTLGIEMEYEEQIGSTRLAMYPVGDLSGIAPEFERECARLAGH